MIHILMLFILIISFLIPYLISKIIRYVYEKELTEECKIGKPCITFKQFEIFYNLSPERFYFGEEGIYTEWKTSVSINHEIYYFKTEGDLIKYNKFIEETEEREEKLNNQRQAAIAKEKLIKIMQSDIDRKAKEAQKQIELTVSEQKEILQRMKKEN